ncbi:MAG: methyltransferase domain-containing protein [Gemmatimonadales bacterium]|nr:methyltransferase domain-containing protein [Gemmatimonadales bacterium]MDZ4390499.1 methyltransferase domain-containing protein [Gemmatimonadales bacterium]
MSQQPVSRAADSAGHETLDIMAQAPRYNAWQVERIAPFLGQRILEVGSGTGNISAELLRRDPERLVLTDMDPAYRQHLKAKFGDRTGVSVDPLMLPDTGAAERYADDALDTAIALNVVEHIEDDAGALTTMRDIVRPGGHVVILVPAMQSIYGTLDTALGHYRRYSKQSLSRLMTSVGLQVIHAEWFNRVGVLGWWFNGRVRRVPLIPTGQLQRFDQLVPLLRMERLVPLPFGQSVIVVGRKR